MQTLRKLIVILVFLTLLALSGCASQGGTDENDNTASNENTQDEATAETGDSDNGETVTLTLAAYTTPREAYAQIIPLFQAYWLEKTGQHVEFEESYEGSGAQSRAVEGGFEADVVSLSLENDVIRLVNAGLVNNDWKENDFGGMVTTSYAVILVRPGNPLGIEDWADLAGEDVEVLTPDPATSGGAQWNVMAAYGAADRGHVEGFENGEDFLRALFTNVSVMDKGARESLVNYESGVGDAIITYENEYYAGIEAGGQYEIVYPTSTILIENPVAVVDTYAEQHGTTEVAQAFVDFLYTPEAQAIFNEIGYRPPVNLATGEQAEVDASRFPTVEDVFTIADYNGWAEVGPKFFGEDGIFTLMIAEVKG
jgi:sulfate/thiosulfate transport system substrate-binding protein